MTNKHDIYSTNQKNKGGKQIIVSLHWGGGGTIPSYNSYLYIYNIDYTIVQLTIIHTRETLSNKYAFQGKLTIINTHL